ncbi:dual specificity protein phosphatase 12-like [Chenopodium quinoa]|uniref:dual specificity protein phosphatase 12-like n=1 Tax=Chenopodium quinoa TaxID=63459 RepID=UPI000B78C02D|nr:dual specificity protein phosphatase 12-like [Chenopodium quinoa]XP_021745823.1 dual specificity protein phosphatase 12-like [Chenopodium quinoa]
MPYLVRENLFISNIGDAAEILEKGSDEITHVLSMLSSSSISFFSEWRSSLVIPAKEIRRVFAGDSEFVDGSKSALSPEKEVYNMEYAGKDLKIVRMAVPLKDTEDENLLDYLDVCLDFIEDGRKNGAVLVHCFAGVSRSAAIITAYLMRSEQLSQEAALESLRQCCEFVSPNDNFLEQLKMFEEMGFKVDRGNTQYKRFRLRILGDSYNRGHKIDSSKFGADPGLPQQVESPRPEGLPDGNKNSNVAYRCKKCRRVVALQENIVDHVPGEGMSAFQWHKRRSGNPYDKSDDFGCSSIFVEPLKWMKAVEEGAIEGKLLCVHCDARLGYFNWSGIQCNCGSWITPAFQLHKSRIDLSTI